MKKIHYYIFAFFTIAFTLFTCKEKALTENAYARLISAGVAGDLDYENPNNHDSSFLTFTVEFYDGNEGADVVEYSWAVKYGDNFGPVIFKTYTKSDFIKNTNGLPELTVTLTFEEIFNALNMTINDFELTTDFQLDATLTTSNGKKFTFVSGANVVCQSPSQGFFRYIPSVTKKPCQSKLAGTYHAKVITNIDVLPWGNPCVVEWEGVIRLEAEHNPISFDSGSYIIYSIDPDLAVELEDASMGVYYGCYTINADRSNLPLGDIRLTESCGRLEYTGTSQWGEIWSIVNVEVNGATLILGIVSDYGEGGEIKLIHTDGAVWQTNLFCEGC